MMPVPCPCCGQPFTVERPNLWAFSMSFTGVGKVRGRLLDALSSAWPRACSMEQLIDAAYWDDPDGGPDDAPLTIRSIICKLRPVTEPLGWTIRSQFGIGYGLVRLAEQTS